MSGTGTERGLGEELLRLAVDVAGEAGELIVARRRRGVELVGTKSTVTDVVTEADRESETLIRSRLRAAPTTRSWARRPATRSARPE